MKSFWRYHIWEALLCWITAVTLVLTFSQGFYIPATVANNIPLALLICGLTLLYAYFGSYNHTTMVCFTLGFVAIAAVFFLWMRSAGIDIIDEEGSATAIYIYYISAPLISLLTFLLSRSRLGIVALFFMGSCLHALFVFLAYNVATWCAALFLLAVIALFLLRQYRITALRSSTVNPDFGRYFGLSAGLCLTATVLALAVWGLVIRPLQPPTVDLTLLTNYMRYDILEMAGIARQYPVPDDAVTSTPPDQTLPVNEPEQSPDSPPADQSPDSSAAESQAPSAPLDSLSTPTESQTLHSVSYDRKLTGWLAALILLVILLLASIPFFRQYLRRRQLTKLTSGTPQEQVIGLYQFYLKKFSRIGCARAPTQTEWEYTERYGAQLAPYLEGGPSLSEMTALYMDARYGGLPASETDCAALASLYPIFLQNYRALSGRIRYLINYFVL